MEFHNENENLSRNRQKNKRLSCPSLLGGKNSGFCWDTRWLRHSYIIMGMLPISVSPTGRIQFKIFSWTMLYSIIMYTLLSSISFKSVFIERLYKLMTLFDDFDSFVYNFMFLSFAKTQYFFSIGGWLAAKSIAAYFNMWTDFEVIFEKSLHHPLVLKNLEQASKRVVFICIVGVMILIFGQLFTLPTYTLRECFGFFPSSSGAFLYIGLMYLNSFATKSASDYLLLNMNRDFLCDPLTQDTVVTYKKLWLNLSNITQYFGVASFNYSLVMLTGSFIDLTVSGYGYLSRVLTKFKSPSALPLITLEEFGLINASVISAYFIVHVSNATYSVTSKVSMMYIDELCLGATNPHHPKVIKEIDKFLVTIKYNYPVISLGGYIDLDRKFITKVFSTIVTYWVVLMQFKVGFIKTDK